MTLTRFVLWLEMSVAGCCYGPAQWVPQMCAVVCDSWFIQTPGFIQMSIMLGKILRHPRVVGNDSVLVGWGRKGCRYGYNGCTMEYRITILGIKWVKTCECKTVGRYRAGIGCLESNAAFLECASFWKCGAGWRYIRSRIPGVPHSPDDTCSDNIYTVVYEVSM